MTEESKFKYNAPLFYSEKNLRDGSVNIYPSPSRYDSIYAVGAVANRDKSERWAKYRKPLYRINVKVKRAPTT